MSWGVYSARWAETDQARRDKMRQELKGKDKTAWFECVICMVLPDGREENFVGKMEGRIIDKVCGGSGFAYDVIFLFDRTQENFWRGYGRGEKYSFASRSGCEASSRMVEG